MCPRFWMTCGPFSLNLAGRRSCHTFACSMTWSSTEMIRGKSSMRTSVLPDLTHRQVSAERRGRSRFGPGACGDCRHEMQVERDGNRLPHVPALDGLRGVAVAIVVAFHLGRLKGGFLGVDLFFVLSGFLITSLLVGGWRKEGRVDLGEFWSRRARRLLPAMLVVVLA